MSASEQLIASHDYAERGAALPPNLDTNAVALCHYNVTLFLDLRYVDWFSNRHDGRGVLHGAVVPGLIMMAIITNTYSNVVSSFFGAKFNNSIELLVSPTPNYIILWATSQ